MRKRILPPKYPEKVAALREMLYAHRQQVTSGRRPAGAAENARPILQTAGKLPTLAQYMNQAELKTIGNIDKSLQKTKK